MTHQVGDVLQVAVGLSPLGDGCEFELHRGLWFVTAHVLAIHKSGETPTHVCFCLNVNNKLIGERYVTSSDDVDAKILEWQVGVGIGNRAPLQEFVEEVFKEDMPLDPATIKLWTRACSGEAMLLSIMVRKVG